MFDWFWEFLYSLIKVPLFCIDFIMEISKKLCGIESVRVDGQDTDITYYFLSSESVLDAFKYVAIIAFTLLFVFTIFTIVKSQAKFGEGKGPLRICLDSAKTVLYFLLVPAIMLLGSVFVSTVMESIYNATLGTEGATLGGSMFVVFADEAYTGSSSGKADVLQKFITGEFSYYSTSKVSEYFELSDLNFFLGLAGSICVLVLLVLAMLTFIERLIHLVVLFIVAPLSMSTAVLDDGTRFKYWRDQTINKFLTAYGSIICLNIFVILINVVNKVEFFNPEFWGGMGNFMNGLARMLFVLGGALACRKGSVLIGNLINFNAGTNAAADSHAMNHAFPGAAKFLPTALLLKGGIKAAGLTASGVKKGAGGLKSLVNKNSYDTKKNDTDKKKEDEDNKFKEKVKSSGAVTAKGGSDGKSGSPTSLTDVLKGGGSESAKSEGGVSGSMASSGGSDKHDDKLKESSDTIKSALKSTKENDDTSSDDNESK